MERVLDIIMEIGWVKTMQVMVNEKINGVNGRNVNDEIMVVDKEGRAAD